MWRHRDVLKIVWPYTKGHRHRLALAVFLTILSAIVPLLEAWPIAYVIRVVSGDDGGFNPFSFAESWSPMGRIMLAVGASLGLATLSSVVTLLNDANQVRFELQMVLDYRTDLYTHAQRLPLTYLDQRQAGSFIYQMNYSAHSVGTVITSFLPLAESAIRLTAAFAILWLFDPVLALLAGTVGPLVFYLTTYYNRNIEPELRRVRDLEGKSMSIIHESMSMVRVVVLFCRQEYERRRFRENGQEGVDARVNLTIRQTGFALVVSLVTAAGTALVVWKAADLIIAGRLDVANLYVILDYLGRVYTPMETISGSIAQLQESFVNLRITTELMAMPIEVEDAPGAIALDEVQGAVELRGVSYSYPGGRKAVSDISFRADPGDLIAIVGPTGAGKSTLVSLLPRLADPSSGQVLLDGHDLRDLTVSTVRERVSVVLQEPLLFGRTVMENIRYGRLDATDDEVFAAAEAANAHDFISELPGGYNRLLGERGSGVSGGERQRICIARSFLKDAPILVLDEPTSAIDSKTEAVILEALDRLIVGRTTFMIAHRLSTIRGANRILVMNGGELVEVGTHDELMDGGALYRLLWEAQHGGLGRDLVFGLPTAADAAAAVAEGAATTPVTPLLTVPEPATAPPSGAPETGAAFAMPEQEPTTTSTSIPTTSTSIPTSTTSMTTPALARPAPAAAASADDPAPGLDRPAPPAPGVVVASSPVAATPVPGRPPKVVLLGMMTKIPVGGVVWQTVHYLEGLRRLGCDVHYVEAHARTPSMFMSTEGDDGSRRAADFIASVMRWCQLDDRWAYHALHDDGAVHGMSEAALKRLYAEADLIINLHGGTEPREEFTATGRLAYLETDPVQLQVELHDGVAATREFLDAHTWFFTFGELWGRPACGLPTSDRYHFQPTRQPVVSDLWTPTGPAAPERFTTVGNWRQPWREVRYGGEVFHWSKHLEWERILDLPERAGPRFELALSSIADDERAGLEAKGWTVTDGLAVSTDALTYRDYIRGSRGELTVAKDQNVRFNSGWFSDRSATYLAAGRPVITQETGFSDVFPVGEGLLSFRDLDEATDAVREVDGDYQRHRRAAREIAREYFEHDRVLQPLLDWCGISTRPAASRANGNGIGNVRPPATRADGTGNANGNIGRPLPADLPLTCSSRRPLVLEPTTQAWCDSAVGVPALPTVRPRHPRASIIVVTHNQLALTRLCLETLLCDPEVAASEVVVVDNGSDDGTVEHLERLAATRANLEVVANLDNRGFAAAVNQGLAWSSAPAVVLLNNDVVLPPRWLGRLLSHLDEPSVGVVGPVTGEASGVSRVAVSYRDYGGLVAEAEERARARAGQVTAAERLAMFCVAMRRDVVTELGSFDERFEVGTFEDDDYCLRARLGGYRVVCAEDVLVHHFGEGTFGALYADGGHSAVFDANRRRFEEKWGVGWVEAPRREDPQYLDLVQRVRSLVEETVPEGADVLVLSRGDEGLLDVQGRNCRHFPAGDDGAWSGHHPADDAEAVDLLERTANGHGRWLVVPQPSFWWLSHYSGFARALDRSFETVADDQDTALVLREVRA